jgi:hypothetical protein
MVASMQLVRGRLLTDPTAKVTNHAAKDQPEIILPYQHLYWKLSTIQSQCHAL